jgi:hypothetical protein
MKIATTETDSSSKHTLLTDFVGENMYQYVNLFAIVH